MAVPLTVRVPADAWADWPVQLNVRASGPGFSAAAAAELTPGREVPEINSERPWQLPQALLGGFNVASTALGGHWRDGYGSDVGNGFPYLFDGMAVEQQNVVLRGTNKPREVPITVELPGTEPLEVAGEALVQPQRHVRNDVEEDGVAALVQRRRMGLLLAAPGDHGLSRRVVVVTDRVLQGLGGAVLVGAAAAVHLEIDAKAGLALLEMEGQ